MWPDPKVLPLKAAKVRRRACECLEDLPGYANIVIRVGTPVKVRPMHAGAAGESRSVFTTTA